MRRFVLVALLAVVAVVLGLRHFGSRAQPAPLLVAPVRARAAPAAARRGVVVDVEGAVARPGLVRLPAGSRVSDAVARAGGLTAKVSRAGVNLAAPVSDGEQVLVPAVGAAGVAAGSSPPGAVGPISLSAATAEQLDSLPGIGPVTAQKIVDFRAQHGPFASVEALDAIPGIGPARIAQLKGLVVP